MKGWVDLPDLSRDALVDLAGWAVYKEAVALLEANAVINVDWQKPHLTGEVRASPKPVHPRLNLRSLAFAENRCECSNGRRGYMCAHAIALCLSAERLRRKQEQEEILPPPRSIPIVAGPSATPSAPKTPRSFKVSNVTGDNLRLRFLLPPNLDSSAPRDCIMTKLELVIGRELKSPEGLFRGATYRMEPNHAETAALLEQWCGGKLFSLLQLKRRQLKQIISLLHGEPLFAWANRQDVPLEWNQDKLAGVSEYLEEPEPSVVIPPTIQVKAPRRPPPPPPRESAVERFKRERDQSPAGPHPMEVDGSMNFLSILLPAREHVLYDGALALVKDNDFRLEPTNRRWWLRDRHKVLNFMARFGESLKVRFGARFAPGFVQRTAGLLPLPVKIETDAVGDRFNVKVTLAADGVGEQEIHRALATGKMYIESGERVYLLNDDQLQKLTRAQEALSGTRNRTLTPLFTCQLHTESLRDAETILTSLDPGFAPPTSWRKRSAALQTVGELEAPPLPTAFDKLLRSYQRIGVAWLWHLYRNKLGGVLADEMGLGKTIQALGLIASREQSAPNSAPALVVCPAGLVENWLREARRFLPDLTVAVHHRERRISAMEMAAHYRVVITSYATLVRDEAMFGNQKWDVIIADEAQHIKNRRTQAAVSLRAISCRARFVLTGTPIENSLDDLRSLFAFILPGYLATAPRTPSKEEKEWVDQRHLAQAAPYILRRSKELVAPELPAKIEQIVYCPMTTAQSRLYESVRASTEAKIASMETSGASEQQIRFAALAQLMRLRQVCADPRLISEGLSPEDSTKLIALGEILNESIDGGHRILVFSQFVSVLTLLRKWLEEQDLTYAYIDGSTRNRVAEAERFNQDSSIPVFLISLKAGGTGLNLTGADTVVHFDPWWNPAAEAQATDRAHRIGQNRKVSVYKLIANNSVEEKVLSLQSAKAELLDQLFDASSTESAKVSLADIKSLL